MNHKLFLTSAGLPKETRNYFLKLLNKKPNHITAAFIPTAADPYEDKWFMEKDKEFINEIGMQIQEIDLKNENKNSLLSKLSNIDVIYLSGGNTFYLLNWIRKSGFDQIINQLLEEGKIYVGSSAGSMVAGIDIESAGWDDINLHDENTVQLKNKVGLNLAPFVISPHFVENDRNVLEKRSKTTKYPIIALNDQQAVIYLNNSYEIIGEGEKIIFNKHLMPTL